MGVELSRLFTFSIVFVFLTASIVYAQCSYPEKDVCHSSTIGTVISEYYEGKCTKEQLNECMALVYDGCSYPSKIDCDTTEETQIITDEWKQGICTREELGECSQNWMDSQQPQCIAEWKCDGSKKYLQNADCSTSNEEDCSYGCVKRSM